MYVQKIVSLKNIKQLNKLLEQGWRYDFSIAGDKYVLLTKRNNENNNLTTRGELARLMPTMAEVTGN